MPQREETILLWVDWSMLALRPIGSAIQSLSYDQSEGRLRDFACNLLQRPGRRSPSDKVLRTAAYARQTLYTFKTRVVNLSAYLRNV
jgi:hypothetical protein